MAIAEQDLGLVVGPEGPQGEQGPQGEKGDTGVAMYATDEQIEQLGEEADVEDVADAETGISLKGLRKFWARCKAAFAAFAHTHDASDINEGTLSASRIGSSTISTSKLADSAVTEAKIKDEAVTNAKLAARSVDTSKLAENAVASDNILKGAVTAEKIANNAVGANQLADGSVSSATLEKGLRDSISLTAYNQRIIEDLLMVDLENPFGEANQPAFIETGEAMRLYNTPDAWKTGDGGGTIVAYREVKWIGRHVIVKVTEGFPHPRIWLNFYNGGSKQWRGWVQV